MRIRTLTCIAVVFTTLLLAASAAFASAPPSTPAVLQSVTFESPNASDTLQVYTSFDPWSVGAPPATWGAITNDHNGGTHGFWCAGSVPGDYPTYPVGTRGVAVLHVPDASEYYESKIQFSYLEPSLGNLDAMANPQPFVIGWSTTATGSSGAFADWHEPLTSTWSTVGYTRGAAGNNPPLTDGWLHFQFTGDPNGTTGGRGVAIDDISVTGYEFGPVIDLLAHRQHGALDHVALTWAKPNARGTNSADPRDIYYRVWRHDLTAGTWSELTTTASTDTTFTDTSADVAQAYQYAVQGYPSAGDTSQWGLVVNSALVDTAQPHLLGITADKTAVAYNGASVLTAPLVDEIGATFGGQGSHIVVQQSLNGGATWSTIAAAVSEPSTGTYSATVNSPINTRYRFVYQPNSQASTSVFIQASASLTTPSTPSKVKRNKSFIVRGKVSRVPVASRFVMLKAFRKQGKSWVLRYWVKVKIGAGSGVASYKLNWKFKLAGAYRVTATVADGYSARTTSLYRTLTAK